MRLLFFFIFLLSVSFKLTGQELIIVDHNLNPIPGVAVFNVKKNTSVLSNSDGVINLSRFNKNDSLVFQHIAFQELKMKKSSIPNFIKLDTLNNVLEQIVVVSDKNENNTKNVAEKKVYISSYEIESLSAANTAELLEKKGGVSVQRSQLGGGSPNIRGFEANKVLLVVDGIRMNNAIYRSGHLQNIITVDEYMLEDVEIIFGPSSVLFGSDALGGTVNMRTKPIYFKNKPQFKGVWLSNINTSYGSLKNNVALTFESNKFATISSLSFKKYGDLKMGESRFHGHDNWGLVHHYVDDENNIVCNPTPTIQKGIGYSQLDILNKMMFKISRKWRITTNFQISNSSNIPRFDKLNDKDSACNMDSLGVCLSANNLKFHSYYYGPQKRTLSSVNLTGFDHFFEKSEFILAHQRVHESRHKWYMDDYIDFLQNPNDTESYDSRISQFEIVDVFSLNTNFRKGGFLFGSETVYNSVQSTSESNDAEYWGIGDTRYPPEGSSLFSQAYYINTFHRFSNKLQIDGGLRYTFSQITGSFPDTMNRSILNLEGLDINSRTKVVSGNIKFVYYPNHSWKISGVSSKGFHSPNVDDMMKIFLKGDNLTIPNINLLPETTLSQELSVTKSFSENLSFYAVGFYTRIINAIIKDSVVVEYTPIPGGPTALIDNFEYEDETVFLFTNQNSKKNTNIFGLTLGFNSSLMGINIRGDYNTTLGKDTRPNAGPLAHIPPSFGKLEFSKRVDNITSRFTIIYSDSKPANEYDSAGVDNLDETAVIWDENGQASWSGSPSWYTLNLFVDYTIASKAVFTIGLENILDAHYKTFGSGLSAAGRSLNYSFKLMF